MIRKKFVILVIASFLLLNCTACTSSSKNTNKEVKSLTPASEDNSQSKIGDIIYNQDKSITLSKVADRIWVYTTSLVIDGSNVPANGLIAISSEGLILIDTPWNDEKTKELVEFADQTFEKSISLAIITHFHNDRVGGIHALKEYNIKAISTELTADLAEKSGYDRPLPEIRNVVQPIDVGDVRLEIYYPGAGHTIDNITVWFPEEKLLFGGCFIKSMDSTSPGNIADADLVQWPISLENVMTGYPDVQTVVPGHGKWGGKELLEHTMEILKANSEIEE